MAISNVLDRCGVTENALSDPVTKRNDHVALIPKDRDFRI